MGIFAKNKKNNADFQEACRMRLTQQSELENSVDVGGMFYRQLHIAIIHGFIEVVYSLIRLAPHPCLLDIVNDYSQTPLHLAVLSRQSRIARRLVAAGASPRCRDLRGNTPLHLACEAGDLETVKEITAPISIQEVESLGLSYGTSVARREIDIEQRNYDGKFDYFLVSLIKIIIIIG